MGHVSLDREVHYVFGAFRHLGVQVRRIEKMHRDPLFWVNPWLKALLFFLVRHVLPSFQSLKENPSRRAISDGLR